MAASRLSIGGVGSLPEGTPDDDGDHGRGSQEARIRAQQIQAITKYTPITLGANVINGLLIGYIVLPIAHPIALLAWLLTLYSIVGVGAWNQRSRLRTRGGASPRAIRRAILNGVIIGAVWATAPILWFPTSSPHAQLVVGTVVTGMICAGAFVLATVSQAAILYVVILTAGALAGLFLSDNPYAPLLSVMLIAYALVVIRSAQGTGSLFASQLRAEFSLRERGEVIELLLAEFEESASDWLFELGEDGMILKHSKRFAQVTGAGARFQTGASIFDFLSRESEAELKRLLARGSPFRNLIVDTEVDGRRRWWKLAAGPIAVEPDAPRRWRGVGSDITEEKTANDRVAFVARTDMLTGLSNREAFREAVADAARQTMRQIERDGSVMAFGCLDLDQFKNVNDALGHAAGDQLLRMVASELVLFGAEGVEIGRLGGDEFGLLFRSFETRETIAALASRIIAALSKTYEIDGERVTIGASVGLAYMGQDRESEDILIRNADLALYRAKHSGGGLVVAYDASMHAEVDARRRMQEDLALALARDELFLTYQPIVSLATRRTVGFEALLRWRRPYKGIVSPAVFIPVAERSDLIIPIGAWILRTACAAAMRWPQPLTISINVSAVQISRSAVGAEIRQALEESGLPPGRLVIEITESLFLKNEAPTTQFLQEMRALGISIALDDFGTGYSSLAYLSRLPIDKIKIDRAFVSGPASLEHRGAIIQAIIGMASGLGMSTTAEGVETEEGFAWLRSQGGDLAQGYLFARPMPAEEIPAFLEREDAPRRSL